jgi:hypothetical protein
MTSRSVTSRVRPSLLQGQPIREYHNPATFGDKGKDEQVVNSGSIVREPTTVYQERPPSRRPVTTSGLRAPFNPDRNLNHALDLVEQGSLLARSTKDAKIFGDLRERLQEITDAHKQLQIQIASAQAASIAAESRAKTNEDKYTILVKTMQALDFETWSDPLKLQASITSIEEEIKRLRGTSTLEKIEHQFAAHPVANLVFKKFSRLEDYVYLLKVSTAVSNNHNVVGGVDRPPVAGRPQSSATVREKDAQIAKLVASVHTLRERLRQQSGSGPSSMVSRERSRPATGFGMSRPLSRVSNGPSEAACQPGVLAIAATPDGSTLDAFRPLPSAVCVLLSMFDSLLLPLFERCAALNVPCRERLGHHLALLHPAVGNVPALRDLVCDSPLLPVRHTPKGADVWKDSPSAICRVGLGALTAFCKSFELVPHMFSRATMLRVWAEVTRSQRNRGREQNKETNEEALDVLSHDSCADAQGEETSDGASDATALEDAATTMLDFFEFKEFLGRAAVLRFSLGVLSEHYPTPASKVMALLAHLSCQVQDQETRWDVKQQLSESGTMRFLHKYNAQLQEIYEFHAHLRTAYALPHALEHKKKRTAPEETNRATPDPGDDPEEVRGDNVLALSYSDFAQCCKNFGLCPAPLSDNELFAVFNACAVTLTTDPNSKALGALRAGVTRSNEKRLLTFPEFKMSFVNLAVACESRLPLRSVVLSPWLDASWPCLAGPDKTAAEKEDFSVQII